MNFNTSNEMNIELNGNQLISMGKPLSVIVNAYVSYTQEDGMPAEIEFKLNSIEIENKPLKEWVKKENSNLDEFDVLYDSEEISNDIYDYIKCNLKHQDDINVKIENGYIQI